MNYIHYSNEQTKAGELMDEFKPIINVNAPRRSMLVAGVRWFMVVVIPAGVFAVFEALDRLGALK